MRSARLQVRVVSVFVSEVTQKRDSREALKFTSHHVFSFQQADDHIFCLRNTHILQYALTVYKCAYGLLPIHTVYTSCVLRPTQYSKQLRALVRMHTVHVTASILRSLESLGSIEARNTKLRSIQYSTTVLPSVPPKPYSEYMHTGTLNRENKKINDSFRSCTPVGSGIGGIWKVRVYLVILYALYA
jgi:hypothetical protein